MNSENMERLIKNLGCSYDSLITNKVIDEALVPISLYEDSDSLEIEPVPGIELVLWSETLRFEAIYITLKNYPNENLPIYEGGLPEPFCRIKEQKHAHALLGRPIVSKTPMELLGTDLTGWDVYQLDTKIHAEVLIDIQYINEMEVSKITFALIERHV